MPAAFLLETARFRASWYWLGSRSASSSPTFFFFGWAACFAACAAAFSAFFFSLSSFFFSFLYSLLGARFPPPVSGIPPGANERTPGGVGAAGGPREGPAGGHRGAGWQGLGREARSHAGRGAGRAAWDAFLGI